MIEFNTFERGQHAIMSISVHVKAEHGQNEVITMDDMPKHINIHISLISEIPLRMNLYFNMSAQHFFLVSIEKKRKNKMFFSHYHWQINAHSIQFTLIAY